MPAPMPEAATKMHAELFAALRPELHAPFIAVVADTTSRLRAGDDQLDVRTAARAALLAVDFAGVSKRNKVAVEVAVDFVVLQVAASLHAAVRESIGQQLALRAILECAGDSACVDAIMPTETVSAANVRSANNLIAALGADNASDKLVKETKTSSRLYNRTTKAQAEIAKSSRDTANAIIKHLQ